MSGRADEPIYPLEHAVARIRATVSAIRGSGQDFVLAARSENFLHGRADLQDTITRLKAFEEADADVLFAPGLPGLEAVRAVRAATSKPINVLLGADAAGLTIADLRAAGVARISLGSALARAADKALVAAARALLDVGHGACPQGQDRDIYCGAPSDDTRRHMRALGMESRRQASDGTPGCIPVAAFPTGSSSALTLHAEIQLETVSIVLFLLLAVVVSGTVSRMLPISLPTPLVQIMLGSAIGLSTSYRVELDPELFLLLFLPPLLFLDGWRIPKDELLKDVSTVVELALGLVLITVIGMGFLIHWMIPAMPLAVAFALAAVVSPTDPIAVSAIAARVPIPRRMMHILEGESLLNDASGLVCLRFAIAAALTGSFSASSAALNFLWVAGAGIAVGVVVTLAATRAKAWVSQRFGEESGSQILVSLLIPFGSYLIAEHLHASGILAAVAAGVTMTFAEISRQAMASTRMRRNSVWDTIQFALNGIIFVLLGEQLPAILAGAAETVRITGHQSTAWLGVYIVAIVAGLAALRFAWVWVSLRLTLLRRRAGASLDAEPIHSPSWRLVAAMSFAGVRGAITLAGVLTLPLTLNDGTSFPGRDLAIFLAAGVIIVSLVIASIALPLLLEGLTMPAEPSLQAEEDAARVAASEAAIREIERAQHDLANGRGNADFYAAAGSRVMALYRDRIESRSQGPKISAEVQLQDKLERELRLVGLKAERESVLQLARDRRVGSTTAQKMIRELDLLEARYRS